MNINGLTRFFKYAIKAVTLCLLSLSSMLMAEANIERFEVTTRPTFVACLNDSIIIDYSLMRIISEKETNNGWHFTRRYNFSGIAVDSSGNNTWSVHGGWTTTEHVDYLESGFITKIHHQSRDILVSDPGNTAGNLFITWTLNGVYDYGTGEWLKRELTNEVSCK